MDEQLLAALKALSDATRLRIVGLLAKSPRTVEALAAALGLGASTISHHLGKLQRAGLVVARAEQYYSVYTLTPGALDSIGQRIANATADPEVLTESANEQAYEHEVIADNLRPNGVLFWPRGLQKQRVLLRWLAENRFVKGVRYIEAQIRDVLLDAVFDVDKDTNKLRRDLISDKLLSRTPNGALYWRSDTPGAQHPGFDPAALPPAVVVRGPTSIAQHLDERITYARLKGDTRSSGAFTTAELDAVLIELGVKDTAAMRHALWREDYLVREYGTESWRFDAKRMQPTIRAKEVLARVRINGSFQPLERLPDDPAERENVVRHMIDRLGHWDLHTVDSVAKNWGQLYAGAREVFEAGVSMGLLARDGDGWRKIM
jgi:DNA-binding transcriptional ArsR family regulator